MKKTYIEDFLKIVTTYIKIDLFKNYFWVGHMINVLMY